ncbi:MAG: hypothetical protein KAR79_00465 [Simkaniaceae bacterium]|nr:hypothetical protein [Simkaniaceae bacterium]
MSTMNIHQAHENMNMLMLGKGQTLTTDRSGNISYISNYNIIGRIMRIVYNTIFGSEQSRLHGATLGTFETIRANFGQEDNIAQANVEGFFGNWYAEGYDKICIRVIADEYHFPVSATPSMDCETDPSETQPDIAHLIREVAIRIIQETLGRRARVNVPFYNEIRPY